MVAQTMSRRSTCSACTCRLGVSVVRLVEGPVHRHRARGKFLALCTGTGPAPVSWSGAGGPCPLQQDGPQNQLQEWQCPEPRTLVKEHDKTTTTTRRHFSLKVALLPWSGDQVVALAGSCLFLIADRDAGDGPGGGPPPQRATGGRAEGGEGARDALRPTGTDDSFSRVAAGASRGGRRAARRQLESRMGRLLLPRRPWQTLLPRRWIVERLHSSRAVPFCSGRRRRLLRRSWRKTRRRRTRVPTKSFRPGSFARCLGPASSEVTTEESKPSVPIS